MSDMTMITIRRGPDRQHTVQLHEDTTSVEIEFASGRKVVVTDGSIDTGEGQVLDTGGGSGSHRISASTGGRVVDVSNSQGIHIGDHGTSINHFTK